MRESHVKCVSLGKSALFKITLRESHFFLSASYYMIIQGTITMISYNVRDPLRAGRHKRGKCPGIKESSGNLLSPIITHIILLMSYFATR